MKSLLIAVMLTVCSAATEDLSGKMFVFPKESKTDYVKLIPTREELTAATVCVRSFTDLSRSHSLFSLSTPSFPNGFLIFKEDQADRLQMNVRNAATTMVKQDYKLNVWQAVCLTWNGKTGVVQLWLDGKHSATKYCSEGSISSSNLVMIGQEQDSHGGGFDIQQSFVGMMTDVNMWNLVLSPCEIRRYVEELNYTPGNVINWRALQYQVVGKIFLVEKTGPCSCLVKTKMPNMFGQSCQG